jgi:hypothetical protein
VKRQCSKTYSLGGRVTHGVSARSIFQSSSMCQRKVGSQT